MSSEKNSKPIPKLTSLKHVHILGVCGTLMGAFAVFLRDRGVRVTGSDENVYPPMSDVLKGAGVELMEGYRAGNLRGSSPDYVVVGNVIRRENPEALEALSGSYVYGSLPEFMEKLLMEKTRNLVIAGTHGKTTTTAWLSQVLKASGHDPAYFVGGVSEQLKKSFYYPESAKLFAIEGDEYDTAFWDKVPKFNHYLPNDVILTSIEFDHADIYDDLAAVNRAFEGLVDRIREGGSLIACTDYEDVQQLIPRASGRGVEVLTYGRGGADYTPIDVSFGEAGARFKLKTPQGETGAIEIHLSGWHSILNATSVWILGKRLGLSDDQLTKGLKSFEGVKRRQEVRGEVDGVTIIDDFAHHPTAVKTTLDGLKEKYSNGNLVAVFEPRSATSRRSFFQERYPECFDSADFVFVAAPHDQSRIDESERFSSERLVDDLKSRGQKAELLLAMASAKERAERILSKSKKGDVVVTLSNGGFGGLLDAILAK